MSDHAELFEKVACLVCNKPERIPHSECLKFFGFRNPLCRDYGKCRLYEKTVEQFNYVLHPISQDSFLRACPGSGKTEVVGMKAAYEIRQWELPHAGIAVLTFTNNAADIIRQRISQFAGGVGYPHYIGTLDSWLHGYVLNPFGHLHTGFMGRADDHSVRIIDPGSEAGFLNAYKTKYNYAFGFAFPNHFYLEAGSNSIVFESGELGLDRARNALALADWQIEDLRGAKTRFWGAGYATLQDVEYICLKLLESNGRIREMLGERFPRIIIDECQDLSLGQLDLLSLLQREGCRLHLVGDLNQAIYAFKKVNPKNIEAFVDRSRFHVMPLRRNFRSLQTIVDLCGKLIEQGHVIGEPGDGDTPACVYFIYDSNQMSLLASYFEKYLRASSIAIDKAAILARGYATVHKLRPAASRVPTKTPLCLAVAVYLWASTNVQAMDDALKCVGRFISTKFFPKQAADSRHHYCPESEESAMEWRLFLARVLDACSCNENIKDLGLTWEMWAKAVRSHVGQIVTKAFQGDLPVGHDSFKFSALKGYSDKPVADSLHISDKVTKAGIRITTIHQAKGETLDAVLLVSSPTGKGDGGHWRQWLNKTSGEGEHARFAYVASSRPRRLLAWAIPEDDEGSAADLKDLGFLPGGILS